MGARAIEPHHIASSGTILPIYPTHQIAVMSSATKANPQSKQCRLFWGGGLDDDLSWDRIAAAIEKPELCQRPSLTTSPWRHVTSDNSGYAFAARNAENLAGDIAPFLRGKQDIDGA